MGLNSHNAKGFDPGLSDALRKASYKAVEDTDAPNPPNSLDEMVKELEVVAKFRRDNSRNKVLITSSGNPTFDSNDIALLDFLAPFFGRLFWSFPFA